MTRSILIKDPALAYKDKLSSGAYDLLNRLVLDYKSILPPEARVYHPKDNASLIYNLFKGKYNFSYKQYKELYIFLTTFSTTTL